LKKNLEKVIKFGKNLNLEFPKTLRPPCYATVCEFPYLLFVTLARRHSVA